MFKKYNFLKYIFLLLVSFEISFAFSQNLNLSYLNQASINIIENCLNSNTIKTKCKDIKFIKENLIKQKIKFDNKSLKKSIEFAINFIENQNNKNDILTNYAISALPQTDDKISNPTRKSNSNNKMEIYLSNENNLKNNENLNTNEVSNLQNVEFFEDKNNTNSKISDTNLDINSKIIEIKDLNSSNDTTFLLSLNSATNSINSQDDLLLNLLNKNNQVYTQKHGFGPAVPIAIETMKDIATYGTAAGFAYMLHNNNDDIEKAANDLLLQIEAYDYRAEYILAHYIGDIKDFVFDADFTEFEILLTKLKEKSIKINTKLDEITAYLTKIAKKFRNLDFSSGNPSISTIATPPNPKKDDKDKDKLTPSQEKSIKKIDEIEHMLKSRNNLSGDMLDKGHIEKLNNAKIGLQREINSLSNSLKNPNLSSNQRNIMQNSINKASDIIGRINELIQ